MVFLVYDVTNPDSFANLDDWLRKSCRLRKKSTHTYVIGNKIDLYNQRQVSEVQHNQYILDNKLSGGFLLSAKTRDSLVKSFYKVAGEVIGIRLTESELECYDQVVTARVMLSGSGNDEGRTEIADEIERLDREAELRKQQCACICS